MLVPGLHVFHGLSDLNADRTCGNTTSVIFFFFFYTTITTFGKIPKAGFSSTLKTEHFDLKFVISDFISVNISILIQRYPAKSPVQDLEHSLISNSSGYKLSKYERNMSRDAR